MYKCFDILKDGQFYNTLVAFLLTWEYRAGIIHNLFLVKRAPACKHGAYKTQEPSVVLHLESVFTQDNITVTK